MMNRLLESWRRFGSAAANIQIRIILTLAYYLVLPFFALIYRFTVTRRNTSSWQKIPAGPQTIEEMKKEW